MALFSKRFALRSYPLHEGATIAAGHYTPEGGLSFIETILSRLGAGEGGVGKSVKSTAPNEIAEV
jgi:hypothetical protein